MSTQSEQNALLYNKIKAILKPYRKRTLVKKIAFLFFCEH